MFYPYISQFNWVDIIIIILVLRMCYISLKRGVGIEVLKFINLCFCAFVAFHFYFSLGEFINSKIPALPLEATLILAYLVLIFIITIIFTIIRDGFFMVFKSEGGNAVGKFLGVTIGFIRGLLISGFLIFGLLISTVHYFELSTKSSFLGPKIVRITTKTYEFIFYGIVSKIFPDQSFNQEITKVTQEETR